MNQSKIAMCILPFYFELIGDEIYMSKTGEDGNVSCIGTLENLYSSVDKTVRLLDSLCLKKKIENSPKDHDLLTKEAMFVTTITSYAMSNYPDEILNASKYMTA